MRIQMMNIHTKKVEVAFEVELDRSLLSFTEKMIEIRERTDETENLIERTELEIVIDSMLNSGYFDNHPRCVTIVKN